VVAARRLRRVAIALALLAVLAADADARPWAWLGVRIRDMSEQEMEEISSRHGIREGFGVVIVEVLEGTPAAKAGLKNGDIVVAFGERPITETRLLQRLIAAAPAGADTRLTVLRREGRQQVDVRLVTMPRDVAGDRVAAEFGFVLRDTDAAGEIPGQRSLVHAPAVAAVLRGGAAEKAGLEVGDVLLQVGERAVVTRDAAREALADVSLDGPLRLTVRRGERRLTLTVSAPANP
jgi:S1-C subfamily serine protease